MESAIVFRWSGPRTGREVEAIKAADMADTMFDALVAQGLATSAEWITNQTGDDADMGILRGDAETLLGMMASPEFRDLANASVYALDGWHADLAIIGANVDEAYPGWRAMVEGVAA